MRWTIFAAALFASANAYADSDFITVDEAKGLQGKAVFVFSDAPKAFKSEHIPGSVVAYAHDLSFLDDVRKCKGLPMCEAHAAKFIGGLGIDANTEIVVYDAGAGANASGTWFLFKLYGHNKVRIMEGGLATWKKHGGAVEGGKAAKAAAKSFKPNVQWNMIASLEEVKKATTDKANYFIVDARHKLGEYAGSDLKAAMRSPGNEITVARGGHIPGAVFSPWTKYAGNKKNKADKPTFKKLKKLKKQVKKLTKKGYGPNKTVISYCHVGLGRGSFQYMALKRAGHDKVKVYIGSWSEWGNTPSLPLGAQP